MEMLLYLLLAAVRYGFLAESTDRAVDREMRKRRERSAGLHLVEDLDDGPDLRPRPPLGSVRPAHERGPEREGRSLRRCALDRQVAVHALREIATDGETKPRTGRTLQGWPT